MRLDTKVWRGQRSLHRQDVTGLECSRTSNLIARIVRDAPWRKLVGSSIPPWVPCSRKSPWKSSLWTLQSLNLAPTISRTFFYSQMFSQSSRKQCRAEIRRQGRLPVFLFVTGLFAMVCPNGCTVTRDGVSRVKSFKNFVRCTGFLSHEPHPTTQKVMGSVKDLIAPCMIDFAHFPRTRSDDGQNTYQS